MYLFHKNSGNIISNIKLGAEAGNHLRNKVFLEAQILLCRILVWDSFGKMAPESQAVVGKACA